MRTTLELDPDVAAKAQAVVERSGKPLQDVINEALRAGLENIGGAVTRKPYRTQSRDMGLRPGIELDNIQELLSRAEGDAAR